MEKNLNNNKLINNKGNQIQNMKLMTKWKKMDLQNVSKLTKIKLWKNSQSIIKLKRPSKIMKSKNNQLIHKTRGLRKTAKTRKN